MVLALVYWALAGALIPSSWEWKMTAMNAVGAVAFFTVACFLPEYRGMRLPNRRFALRLSAFFVFLGIREAQETESAREYFRMSNADRWIGADCVLCGDGHSLLSVRLSDPRFPRRCQI